MPRRRDYVCSATAFLILLAGPDVYTPGVTSGAAGASLTQFAVAAELGAWTALLMSVLVVAASSSARSRD
ncbi:hypothetical protein PU560_01995 [Georgenia sp. 10Sc9-8]|uniref:DUF998 domain-containing protein n=1 Tax=Georgenia halotolerans TaxID=3028317 RepID=A0ABT5TT53_9MICO|nr:hypothetical protein [Georgenia halotolerans]